MVFNQSSVLPCYIMVHLLLFGSFFFGAIRIFFSSKFHLQVNPDVVPFTVWMQEDYSKKQWKEVSCLPDLADNKSWSEDVKQRGGESIHLCSLVDMVSIVYSTGLFLSRHLFSVLGFVLGQHVSQTSSCCKCRWVPSDESTMKEIKPKFCETKYSPIWIHRHLQNDLNHWHLTFAYKS